MRLAVLEHGHSLRQKFLLGFIRLFLGGKESGLDLIKMLLYRPEYFGKRYSNLLHGVMRDESVWSVGERELFAAFTSRQNQCSFCFTVHRATATKALEDNGAEAILADWRAAPLDDRMRAMLGFLEKMTHRPDEISAGDATALRATGLTDRHIKEALHVSALFHIINRLADAFDFEVPSTRGLTKVTKELLKRGYRM